MAGEHRKAPQARAAFIAALCSLAAMVCMAQEPSSGQLPDAPSASAQSQTTPMDADSQQGGTGFFSVLQKKSMVFPTLATDTGPLDPWQKFKLAANNSVSLATIGGALIGSAFSQAINTPEGYGQGAEGYGKRFGADMARSASSNLMGNFVIASVMHEDPRFYVKKDLSVKESIKYCAVRVVATRSDSGEPVPNFAGLLGPLAAEGLATTYYPEGNNGVADVFTRYAFDIGWQFGGNLLRQYWPKINRKLKLLP